MKIRANCKGFTLIEIMIVVVIIVPNYLKTQPTCPLGPGYDLQVIGTCPSCPNPDHVMPQ